MFRKPCLKRPTEIPRYQVLQQLVIGRRDSGVLYCTPLFYDRGQGRGNYFLVGEGKFCIESR